MALNPHPQNDFETQTYTFIRRHEALVRRVYNDGRGIPTLGVGFALIINIGTRENPNWQIRPQLGSILQQAGITLTPNDTNILVRVRNILNDNPLNAQQQIAQIVPLCSSTRWRVMVNPRPVPPARRVDELSA